MANKAFHRATILAALLAFQLGAHAQGPAASAPAQALPAASNQPQQARPRGEPPFAFKTPCSADTEAAAKSDPDLVLQPDANFRIMFHGNRFVLAKELTAAFEAENPGVKVAYTTLPPLHTVRLLRSGGVDGVFGAGVLPDVVMGPSSFAEVPVQVGGKTDYLDNRGMYSRINGLVLMARANDARVSGPDWKAILSNRELRPVLAGEQQKRHMLVRVFALAMPQQEFDDLPSTKRVGVSSMRHHRAIPARIAASCEDVGVQFLQSRAYWEATKPGTFKFIAIDGIQENELAIENSFVWTLKGSPNAKMADKFAEFMDGPAAMAILKKYSLEP